MSDIENTDNYSEPGRYQREEQIEKLSFSNLADNPSVPLWRKKLESLLAGESSETLWRLGSIEQYIRVVLAESKVTLARYYFHEALSQTIQDWNPLVLESAHRLNGLLSLIAAFTPAIGFGKVLHYLNRSEGVKRTSEVVSVASEPVDLYKKGLVALAQYYPTAPFNSSEDLGFAEYRELLERNLKDERYSGYAAVRLIQLKTLNTRSDQFAQLLMTSDRVGQEVFRKLLSLADDPDERESVGKEFGNILVTCARNDNLERFQALAAAHDAVFNPVGDYEVFFPTLTLKDGVVIDVFLSMEEIHETALTYFVEYSGEKVHELLTETHLNKTRIARYISGYLKHTIKDPVALNALVKDLASERAQIRISNNNFVLTVSKEDPPKDIILKLDDSTQTKLLIWNSKRQVVAKDYDFATTTG